MREILGVFGHLKVILIKGDDPWQIKAKKLILYVLGGITIIFAIGFVFLRRVTFPQVLLLVLVLLTFFFWGLRFNRVDDKQREELPKKRRARVKRKK